MSAYDYSQASITITEKLLRIDLENRFKNGFKLDVTLKMVEILVRIALMLQQEMIL